MKTLQDKIKRIEEIDKIILELELSDRDFVNAKYIGKLRSESRELDKESQQQIRFELVCCNTYTGPYRNSPPKSVGGIVHWLRAFGLRDYDLVTVGWNNVKDVGEVNLHGKQIATYIFTDMENPRPIFTFIGEYNWVTELQVAYNEGLSKFEDPYKQYETKKNNT